jgi:hypothetical protein
MSLLEKMMGNDFYNYFPKHIQPTCECDDRLDVIGRQEEHERENAMAVIREEQYRDYLNDEKYFPF